MKRLFMGVVIVLLLAVLIGLSLPMESVLAARPLLFHLSSVQQVSVAQDGTNGNGDSRSGMVSPDGQYVVFQSAASNFVAGDTNDVQDIFLKNLQTGVIERISVTSSGTQGNGDSWSPSISADNRYVAFHSYASNLVTGDTNGLRDVFVKDRQTGSLERISQTSTGTQGNGVSTGPKITADGRYVYFYCDADNLVANDTNEATDIYRKDRQTGAMIRASVTADGSQANNRSSSFDITPDGRYFVFGSLASNLVSGDTNNKYDIFVRDMQTGAIERINLAYDGSQANYDSHLPSISADGRYVVFESGATNLTLDTAEPGQIFLVDRVTDMIIMVSKNEFGDAGDYFSQDASISGNGRFISFTSYAANLVPYISYLWSADIFVYDRLDGSLRCASVNNAGEQVPTDSEWSRLNADGSKLLMYTYIAMGSAEPNAVLDLFVVDIESDTQPETPVIYTPYNNDSMTYGPSWYSWKPVPGADRYTVEVKNASDNSMVFKEDYSTAVYCHILNGCHFTPSEDSLPQGVYKWHAVAWSGDTSGEWSAYNVFYVTPRWVELRSPGEDAIVYGGRPTLKWYPVDGATVYDVELYGLSDELLGAWTKGTGACDGLEYCEYRIPFDLEGAYGTYDWRVRARNTDANVSGDWSETRSFTYTQLERTWQISPVDGYITSDTSPTLQWTDITGATMYLVNFRLPDDTFLFNVLVSDATYCDGSTCTWDVDPALALGEYKWHVRAKNGRNFGRWTAYRTIIIE